MKLGQPKKALESLSKALAIRPYQPATHVYLAQVYDLLRDSTRAAEHLGKARWLREHNQE
jgi:Tfp pilus assembly protein PilF